MPKAARERVANPPAGTAPAPKPRYACAAGPLRGRGDLWFVTETETRVKICRQIGEGFSGFLRFFATSDTLKNRAYRWFTKWLASARLKSPIFEASKA
jgi:hypothetical protein